MSNQERMYLDAYKITKGADGLWHLWEESSQSDRTFTLPCEAIEYAKNGIKLPLNEEEHNNP